MEATYTTKDIKTKRTSGCSYDVTIGEHTYNVYKIGSYGYTYWAIAGWSDAGQFCTLKKQNLKPLRLLTALLQARLHFKTTVKKLKLKCLHNAPPLKRIWMGSVLRHTR